MGREGLPEEGATALSPEDKTELAAGKSFPGKRNRKEKEVHWRTRTRAAGCALETRSPNPSALHTSVPPQLHALCGASNVQGHPYLGPYLPLPPLEPSSQGCPLTPPEAGPIPFPHLPCISAEPWGGFCPGRLAPESTGHTVLLEQPVGPASPLRNTRGSAVGTPLRKGANCRHEEACLGAEPTGTSLAPSVPPSSFRSLRNIPELAATEA